MQALGYMHDKSATGFTLSIYYNQRQIAQARLKSDSEVDTVVTAAEYMHPGLIKVPEHRSAMGEGVFNQWLQYWAN